MRSNHFQNTLRTGFLLIAGLLFSFWLMFHTFSYDHKAQSLRIAAKAWSDFGAHIPLIRSFSQGENSSRLLSGNPIESPLYPGEPIRYHFGFYALVGILEKIGLPLDWALNLPSALGFFGLLLAIYLFSFKLFGNRTVSVLSVLFFLLNGSLAFVSFFRKHPLSIDSINQIIANNQFVSFGPWDGGLISAFWNLNIYTNQRHLGLSYGLALGAILMCLLPKPTRKRHVFGYVFSMTIIMSTLIFVNFPAAAIAVLFLAWIWIVKKDTRIVLSISALITLPAFGALYAMANLKQDIVWHIGYLANTINIPIFVNYWWHNIGLHMILIPIGILLAPKNIRRLLLLPLMTLFVIPNLFRFSPDIINNHKFFNFFLIIGNMFSAYTIVRLWNGGLVRKALSGILIVFLTLSGVIDLFPVINDYKGAIADRGSSEVVRFFATQTQPTDIVANSTWFYHPASLAGRSIFSGYTYFTWSYGYNQGLREQQLNTIYESPTQELLCRALKNYNVSYIELSQTPEGYLHPNWILWNNLQTEVVSPTGQRIYKTATICTPTHHAQSL